MSALVRKADARDALELIALNQQFDGSANVLEDVAAVGDSLNNNATEVVYVAELNGHLVGFVSLQITRSFSCERPTAELTGIFVQTSHRRTGVASGLVSVVIADCESRNVLELFPRVNRANDGAIQFYRDCGLQEADHFEYRIEYYEE